MVVIYIFHGIVYSTYNIGKVQHVCVFRSPIAVGKTALSSEEMYEAAMRGKGVIIMHTYKDHLW